MKRACLMLLLAAAPCGAATPEALGLFGTWGAFRARDPLHCYAIAEPAHRQLAPGPYLTVTTTPGTRSIRAVHVHLRRPIETARIVIDAASFPLTVRGAEAWPARAADSRRIAARLRDGQSIRVEAKGGGRHFTDQYLAAGAASAIDAADIACMAGR